MKKGKKILFTAMVTMLFTLFLGINTFAAEYEAIVPTPKDYKGSEKELLEAAMDWVNTNPQEYTTEKGAICVPVQVSKAGKVYIGVKIKEDITLESGLAVIMSASDDVGDQSGWMVGGSGTTILFGDDEDEGMGAVAFSAEKAGTFYLHAFSAEVVDNPITIQAAAFQTGISVKASNVSISKTSVTWNGKAQKPAVTAKDSSGKKISSGSYTVKYTNNKNVGQATATITFKNGYSGTVKKTFTIVPKGTSLSNVAAKGKGFAVKWKKQAAQTTGYEIQYAASGNFKGAKTIGNINSKVTSKNVTNLKAKTKYYVRIRTYKTAKVNGKNVKLYSSWSKAKTVVVKK